MPGSFDDGINISLETLDLANDDNREYEALSYAWGSKDNLLEISITDPSTQIKASLPVTRDLALALRYLRLPQLSRTLWIDAICIDQENLEERGHQVKKMGDVYHTARQVIIWLGPATDDSSIAVRSLREISAMIEVDWNTWAMRLTTPANTNWANTQIPWTCDDKTLNAIEILLQAPWFHRLWIWQEVLLSRRAEIYVGHETLPWSDLRKANFYMAPELTLESPLPRASVNLTRLVAKVHRLAVREAFDAGLLVYIEATISCQFSDPRDRIYALLGLVCRNDCVLELEPDYTQPASTLFQKIVLLYLRRESSLDTLACCELSENSPLSPSWVPDWSNRIVGRRIFVMGNLGNRSIAKADSISAGQLRATGISAAVIDGTSPGVTAEMQEKLVLSEVHQMIERLSKYINTHQPYIDGGDIIEAFCRTLITNCFARHDDAPADSIFPSFGESLACVGNICRNGKHNIYYKKYLHYLKLLIQCKCFITTHEGYIGLAPLASEAGDQVCIILGCRSPLVLRPTTKGTYTVVGECFVHGLMQDEAFLGPLPHKMESSKARGKRPREWTIRDPGTEEGPDNWYVHTVTGEEVQYPLEPRMTAESMQARGVELREFVLE
ncbi:MAG: hypothetical protein LQ339_000113 [Xanthoria mediterranea]|nr:MAG: hypothetical protein LQ339_000113 [Xanthoria mediterranea]